LGLVTVLLVSASGTIIVELGYLQLVGSTLLALVPASVVALAAVGFAGRVWVGPAAFAGAALWVAAVGTLPFLPLMAVAAGVGMVVAGVSSARFRPVDPTGEST
jgi:hypothetical protein